MKRLGLILMMSSVNVAGCAKDPVYIAPDPAAVEVNGATGGDTGTSSVLVPILHPTDDAGWQALSDERSLIAEQLMIGYDQVPIIRRDELFLEIEWTVKNLDDEPGTATVSGLGANEWFAYDPQAFVIDPQEDEPPPPLLGGIPVEVPALGTVSGVFREDELSEAAQDLDALTRWGVTPERAMLTRWATGDIVDANDMFLCDGRAVPSLLRIDLTLTADHHMVMEFVLRVRDHTDHLDPNAEDWEVFEAATMGSYVPPPPDPTMP